MMRTVDELLCIQTIDQYVSAGGSNPEVSRKIFSGLARPKGGVKICEVQFCGTS